MAASSVAAFWVVALLLIVVPGADWAFVIGTVLGGRPVLPAVGGLVLGYAGLTIVVAAGVGAVVARSPAALTALTVAGGLYLIWLGARSLARPGGHGVAAGAETGAGRSALVRGVGVSGLNPKGLLVLLALLPQFASPRGSWPLSAQLGLLGLVFTLSCTLFYLGLGSSARRVLHTRPRAAAAISRLSGAAMFVIGALLLAERLVR